MLSFGVIAGWICVAAWSYLLGAHGRFWSIRAAQADPKTQANTPAGVRVAVVVPARNEADVIGRAIHSLLSQSSPNRIDIFVVDDHSSDATADAALAAGAPSLSPSFGDRVGASHRVTVITGRVLPPGWSGKLWAVQQGVEQALQLNPDFLLLTDADIEHAPDSIARLLSIADAGGYDLVSFMVKLHCRSVAEKLLIPAFVFFFFLLYPPEYVRVGPRLASKGWTRTLRQAQGRLWGTKTAAAAGGCMLIRPAALERIGGIAAIRQEIIDDCALARAVKRSGGKVWLGLETFGSAHDFSDHGVAAFAGSSKQAHSYEVAGSSPEKQAQCRQKTSSERAQELSPALQGGVSGKTNPESRRDDRGSSGLQPATETRGLRAYGSFAKIERMIARTAFNQLHHSFWLLVGTVLGMLLLFALPMALMVRGSPLLAGAGAFAYGLMTCIYLPMVRYYRSNPLWALTLPFAGVFYTAATIHSAVKYWTGRGGEWKGRAQDITASRK